MRTPRGGLGAAGMRGLAALSLAWVLASCATLEYRRVQQDFTTAVVADNQSAITPFQAGAAEGAYATVAAELTPDYIGSLEPRLRANAWMLRAVSQWRVGAFEDARASASRGLSEPGLRQHSRDHLILSMVPALTIDSDLRNRFTAAGGAVDADTYPTSYEADFKTAIGVLDQVDDLIGEATPEDVVHYARYQRWRVLANWSRVIEELPFGGPAQLAALREAERVLNVSLEDAKAEARDGIPTSHPLRGLIGAQGG